MRESRASRRMRGRLPAPRHAPRSDVPVRRNHIRQRVPAVPRPADHGEADSAVVRRRCVGVDHLSRVLPGDASRRLRLFGPRRASASASRADRSAHRTARAVARRAADRPRGPVEADWLRESLLADPAAARGDDRLAVFPAVDDEPLAAGMARAGAPRLEPLSAVRAVESRVDARARRLPVPVRALGTHARASAWMVGRLLRVRPPLRGGGLGRRCAGWNGRNRPPLHRATRRRRMRHATKHRPPSRGSCCGPHWPARRRCFFSPCRTTSRRTSRPYRCCGSCRLRSTC